MSFSPSKYPRDYFALYAEACFANFGDRVKRWITINEPLQTAVNGYGIGVFAPGGCEGETARCYLAAHHQILAHAAAVDVYRRKFKAAQGGEVGLVVDCEWAEPFSEKAEDQIAAQRRIDFQFGWYVAVHIPNVSNIQHGHIFPMLFTFRTVLEIFPYTRHKIFSQNIQIYVV
jgi:beta-glucosidase/6-phospho-beta-glucosidase/beta-galactosidase